MACSRSQVGFRPDGGLLGYMDPKMSERIVSAVEYFWGSVDRKVSREYDAEREQFRRHR